MVFLTICGFLQINRVKSMSLASLIIRVLDALYIPVVARFVPKQIYRYGACGALNMVADATLYFIIYNFIVAKRFVDLGFVVISPHIVSLAVVFPITLLNGFLLNRYVAFRTTDISGVKQFCKYLFTVLVALVINYVSMKILVEYFGIWATPSKLITTVITTVYSYLVARFYTFKAKSNNQG